MSELSGWENVRIALSPNEIRMLTAVAKTKIPAEKRSKDDVAVCTMIVLHLALAHFDKIEPFWKRASTYQKDEQIELMDQLEALVKAQVMRIESQT